MVSYNEKMSNVENLKIDHNCREGFGVNLNAYPKLTKLEVRSGCSLSFYGIGKKLTSLEIYVFEGKMPLLDLSQFPSLEYLKLEIYDGENLTLINERGQLKKLIIILEDRLKLECQNCLFSNIEDLSTFCIHVGDYPSDKRLQHFMESPIKILKIDYLSNNNSLLEFKKLEKLRIDYRDMKQINYLKSLDLSEIIIRILDGTDPNEVKHLGPIYEEEYMKLIKLKLNKNIVNLSLIKRLDLKRCDDINEFMNFLSIESLQEISCSLVKELNLLNGVYPNITKLDLGTDGDICFNLEIFPNLTHLDLFCPKKLSFSGKAEKLLKLGVHGRGETTIDFRQFPVLRELYAISQGNGSNLKLKNEKDQLQKLDFALENYDNLTITNCSFKGLKELILMNTLVDGKNNDRELMLFIDSPIDTLRIFGLADINILKKMKNLKNLKIDYPGFEKTMSLKEFGFETVDLISAPEEMRLIGVRLDYGDEYSFTRLK